MADTAIANPYEPCLSLDEVQTPLSTRLQSTLIELLALVLILRGCFTVLLLPFYPSLGLHHFSHFDGSIVTKDAIYGISALAGGVMLHFRYRIGWWSAIAHWCWYIPYMLSGTAAAFGWRIPVYHDPPSLSRSLACIALFAVPGLAILLWSPIATACHAPQTRRWTFFGVLLLVSAIATVATNYWADL